MKSPVGPAGVRVAGTVQARYGIADAPVGPRGDTGLSAGPVARTVAAEMNRARDPGATSIAAGDLAALSLLHEIAHLLVERYEATVLPEARAQAVADLRAGLGRAGDRVLHRFATTFPSRLAEPEDAASLVGEMLLIRLANENPAVAPLRELVDDRPLARTAVYKRAVSQLEAFFASAAPFPVGDGSGGVVDLIVMLRAPARHSPTSLAGQLKYVRDHWTALLGDDLGGLLDRLDIALGVLAERERGLHLRFGGGGGGAAGRPVDTPDLKGLDAEVERFSADSDWMPRLVLLAKSTYVWLDQLSRQYGRDIHTLDAIPDEELDTLGRRGITGLWLIGLWQRSRASETIKRRRGNPDAVASAYSLDDYRIADDLGGEDAYASLRDRAWVRGIRLASDMVPNHMGIDSRWVVEHPEWFLSLPEPPYPAYTFNGPDLSTDGRASIVLEDHYWDNSDAAVVFKHHDHRTGTTRYIYHGNDGTSFPWNDTAQLDFIQADVREQVIRTILDVARRFPVIRFDAAMVLARKHVERLWWPLPGAGDGIPSRAEHAMRKAAFDRLMPTEFWRDVVDRVAAEVPDTLLLAEAFWLLEGYFVRTLGMHRVYNSAFMHMLRDEDNAGYRRVISETLEFDPDILGRYVNFMSNPDEATAVEQFGSGDKYLGVATMLATLPGLPMLGHGQFEGYTEKYGMEFRRARLEEQPDPDLLARHEQHLVPLMRRRGMFAGAHDFRLYDFIRNEGGIDENVFAYSNGSGDRRSLVVYHNRFAETWGSLRTSVSFAVKGADGSKSTIRRSLADGLQIHNDPSVLVAWRDQRSGLEFLRPATALHANGLPLVLHAYQCLVLTGFRELRDGPAQPWSRLAVELGERGVPSLDDALRDTELAPVHDALRAAADDPGRLPGLFDVASQALGRSGTTVADGPGRPKPGLGPTPGPGGVTRSPARRVAGSSTPAAAGRRVPVGEGDIERLTRRRNAIERATLDETVADPRARAVLEAWALLDPLEARYGAGVFANLRLGGPLDRILATRHGLDEATVRDVGWNGAVLAAAMVAPTAPAARLAAWIDDPIVRAALRIHDWQGAEWIDGEAAAAIIGGVALADAIDGLATGTARSRATRLRRALEGAGYQVAAIAAAARRKTPKS